MSGTHSLMESRFLRCCPIRSPQNCLLLEQEIWHFAIQVAKARPIERKKFSQGHASVESIVCRCCFALSVGDLPMKKVFIIGDDDLTSLVMGFTEPSCQIVVCEIDKRIVKTIGELSNLFQLRNVNAVWRDIELPLLPEWKGAFDVFFADPSESMDQIKLFLKKGVASLNPKEVCTAHIGIPSRAAFRYKWLAIERAFLEEGCCISHILDDFNEYPKWFTSSQFRLLRFPAFIE